MEQALELARGPLFRIAFAAMLLGLIRLVVLSSIDLYTLFTHAQNKRVPAGVVVRETLRWLFPFTRVPASQRFVTLVSMAFHLSVIIVPVFLVGHILLWERALGVRWLALDQRVADYMTLIAIGGGLFLFARRASANLTRSLSRVQDYLLPLVIVLCFLSGYLAVHPAFSPFEYNATMLVHVASGDLVLLLIPFSKLSHVLLMPITHLVSELGWRLVPDSGSRVSHMLGKEGEPV